MKNEPVFVINLLEDTDELINRKKAKPVVSDEDIANILNILDDFGNSDMGRLKISVDENKEEGIIKKERHHGRCDVGYKLDLNDKNDGTC